MHPVDYEKALKDAVVADVLVVRRYYFDNLKCLNMFVDCWDNRRSGPSKPHYPRCPRLRRLCDRRKVLDL